MREIYFRYQLSSLGGPTNTWLPVQKKTLERLVADYSKNEPNVIDLDRDYSLVYREGDLLGAAWDGRVYLNNIPEEERPKYYLEEVCSFSVCVEWKPSIDIPPRDCFKRGTLSVPGTTFSTGLLGGMLHYLVGYQSKNSTNNN